MLRILLMYPEHKEFKILKHFYDHTTWEGKPKAVKLFYGLYGVFYHLWFYSFLNVCYFNGDKQ